MKDFKVQSDCVPTMCVALFVSYLTLSQLSPGDSLFSRPKTQLSADHTGGAHVPQMVAHGAPLALFKHFDPTLSSTGPGLQTHDRLRNKRESLGEKSEFVK